MLERRLQHQKTGAGIFGLCHLFTCDRTAQHTAERIAHGHAADHLQIALKIAHSTALNRDLFVV